MHLSQKRLSISIMTPLLNDHMSEAELIFTAQNYLPRAKWK